MIKKLFKSFGINIKYKRIWITKRFENLIWIGFVILSIYKFIN